MAGREHPPSLKDLHGRLEAARSRQHDRRGAGGKGGTPVSSAGLGFGMRLAVDLLAGLALGVGIGLVLDDWLNTAPLMLVVFLFLGAAAGMLNVYRAATGRGFAVGYTKPSDEQGKEEEPRPGEAGKADNEPRDDAADRDRGGKS